MAMQAAEIELKFPVADVRAFRTAVEALGFTLVTERTFESNTLYDTEDRQLRERRQILRLREYGDRRTLTHKRQPEGEADTRYKTRIETESSVEDCAAIAEVFAHMGYVPAFRYEKYRTEWVAPAGGDGKLVLDETPIGVWAELEGEPAWIDAMLERLGVNPEQCLTDSYGKLFLRWKEESGSPAEHLTFEEAGVAAAV